VLVWGSVGFYLVLFNAAMSSIPRDIFEAALIDGAGRYATFVKVTMPLLWDTIQTSWVYLAILALDVYALVAVMTAGPGGPDNSTQVISLQIAQNGFQFGRAGYASAMGVVLFFFTLIIATVMLRITRRDRVEY
jgi:N-acetylglucosamine transport system permease protein